MGASLDELEALFAPAGPLAQASGSYARRPEQVRLARETALALASSDVLLADAPTGTGKSLGYLAPAVLSGQRVVVSTATIALQHQLLTSDLPLLRNAVARLRGMPQDEAFTYAIMKGRRNFLCDRRTDETIGQGTLAGQGDAGVLSRLDLWRQETGTGDREDLDFTVPAGVWMEVVADGEDCAPRACPHRESCFYFAHRDAAELFFDELRVNQSLGDESAAPRGYNILTSSLSAMRTALVNDPKEEANAVQGMVGRLRRDLMSFYKKSGAKNATKSKSKSKTDTPDEEGEDGETHAHAVMPGRPVKGSDLARRPYPELRSWLVETADAFRDEVLWHFDEGGVVLTSATLAPATGRRTNPERGQVADAGGPDTPQRSFGYLRRRLGITDEDLTQSETGGDPRRVRELSVPEIFDYENRCLIYTEPASETGANGGPNSPAETRRNVRRVEELVEASGGRALILLSTTRAVRAFEESFSTRYPVRYQGEDTPSKLVRWLKDTEGAVLVGTRTFWEGVDVAGEALSLVVIDRVPFPVPDDPVIQALCKKAGKAWFKEVSLPRAQVAMRQGSGRLLRTTSDTGVVALLDTRLQSKNWSGAILRALPGSPVTSSIADVRGFFAPGRDEAAEDTTGAGHEGPEP